MYRIIIVLLWLVCLSSCKSIQKSSASQTEVRNTLNSELITHNSELITHNSKLITQSNGYIFIEETETITEYDTSKPGNPVAKKTEKKKQSKQGTQTSTNQSCHSEQSEESESASKEENNSQLSTFNSQLETSVPVVQTTTRWYIIGGIIIAAITLVTAIITRRKQKQRARGIR